jgi:hypothetical protein
MKIDGAGSVGGSGEVPGKKNEKVSGASFGSVLDNAIGTGSAPVSHTADSMPVSTVMPTTSVGGPFKAMAVEKIDTMLDDMEIYKNSLANSDVPAGHLRPMADTLKQKKEELVSLLKVVDDPELRDIMIATAALFTDEDSRYHALTHS